MTTIRLYTTLLSVCLVIHVTSGVGPPDFPNFNENDNNQCPRIDIQADSDAVLNTFVANLVDAFGGQADNDGRQFAVLILVPRDVPDIINMPFEPHDEEGYPRVDNTHAISPVNLVDRVNYVVSRPYYNDDTDQIDHAERLVLNELEPLLHSFRCHYGQDPAAIILYTWIFPCASCFVDIAHALDLDSNIPRIMLYSTMGMRGVDDENVRRALYEENNFIINFLRGVGIFSMHVRCLYHPNRGIMKRAIDEETCPHITTVQTCLFNKLLAHDEVYCGSPENQKERVVAELVNRLMDACRKGNFRAGCAYNFFQTGVVQGACSELHSKNYFPGLISSYVDSCLRDGNSIISKPLSIERPHEFPGNLSTTSQLYFNEKTIPCEDPRRKGLFCSHWKSNYLTAGNGVCKLSSSCGYHGGTNYRWCNLEIGDWNYCCDEGASCINGYCRSGNKQVWCFGDPVMSWTTLSGRKCIPYTPCGYHNGLKKDKWCWVDNEGKTEYCK